MERVVYAAPLSAESRVPPGARGRIAPRKAIAREVAIAGVPQGR